MVINHIFIIGLEYKNCLQCGYYRQVKYFSRDSNTVDRLAVYCGICLGIDPSYNGKKRGRPKGHKLSQETKDKIRKSMTGKIPTYKHRRNIAKSLKGNTNRKNDFTTLKDDLLYTYQDKESKEWISRYSEELENVSGIRTTKSLVRKAYYEVPLFEMDGTDIANIDPLELLLIKEELGEDIWKE